MQYQQLESRGKRVWYNNRVMRLTIEFLCPTAEATGQVAAKIGRLLKGGEVVELLSDLGGGKTTFVKGLAKGMGVTDVVQSPTFTLSQIHQADHGLELHHYDFYRLSEAGIMRAELAESLSQPNAVVAIEWGEIVHDVLPERHITIRILTSAVGEARRIVIALPKEQAYLKEAAQ